MADKQNFLLNVRMIVLPTRTEFQIEPTPRALYEILPFKELHLFKQKDFVKEIRFTYKRKNFILCFYRRKEEGE